MNPHCTIDLAAFTITRGQEPLTSIASVVGQSCPTLIYVAAPYILAMQNGVSFPWEKQKDSVLVACPAGHVDFVVRKAPDGNALITIVRNDGHCVKHTVNQAIKVPAKPDALQTLGRVFPFLHRVSDRGSINLNDDLSLKNERRQENSDARAICACDVQAEIDSAVVSVCVMAMNRSCAYHRKKGNFMQNDLLPAGLCAFAYQNAYPMFLSMLYGKIVPNSWVFSCPGTKSRRVNFVLTRKARLGKPFLEILEKVLNLTPLRLDLVKYSVELKVVSIVGVCDKRLKAGNGFVLGKKKLVCPSSFYSFFPSILSRLGNEALPHCTTTCTSVSCRICYGVGFGNGGAEKVKISS